MEKWYEIDRFSGRPMLLDEERPRYGVRVEDVEGGIRVGVSSCATMKGRASIFLTTEQLNRCVLLRVGFNARNAATITGDAVRWAYADGHGMCLAAVLTPGTAELWVPGHHGHGPGSKIRLELTESLELTAVPLPGATKRLDF